MKNECYGCTNRYVGCHSECASYKAFREKCDTAIEERSKRSEDVNVDFLRINNILKEKRRKTSKRCVR